MRLGPLGIWELLIILVVVLLILGPSRLPAMAKGIGQSIREFRQSLKGDDDGEPDDAGEGRSDGSR